MNMVLAINAIDRKSVDISVLPAVQYTAELLIYYSLLLWHGLDLQSHKGYRTILVDLMPPISMTGHIH